MGKGACIKRMGAVKNYTANTTMEKNKRGWEGVKDMELSGVF